MALELESAKWGVDSVFEERILTSPYSYCTGRDTLGSTNLKVFVEEELDEEDAGGMDGSMSLDTDVLTTSTSRSCLPTSSGNGVLKMSRNASKSTSSIGLHYSGESSELIFVFIFIHVLSPLQLIFLVGANQIYLWL